MQKKELNLKETKEILLKAILDLRKEIKNADEIKFEVKKGTTDLPNEKDWNKLGYDGNMDISIHLYSKKNDEREKFPCEHDWIDITVHDEKYGNTYRCNKCGEEKFEPYKKEPTKRFGVIKKQSGKR